MSMRVGLSGTLLQSPGISAATTTFKSNRDDGYLNVPLVSSRTPDGLAWNDVALSDLRIGIQDADSNARPLMVTSAWAFVEYPVGTEPPPPIPGAGPLDAGVTADAGVDAGVVEDAGTDAGMVADAGGLEDAGLNEPDAGLLADGGVNEPDAGTESADGGRGTAWAARVALGPMAHCSGC